MSHGFEERSESRVEPDKGNHDKDKQANIFQNMRIMIGANIRRLFFIF